MNNSPEQKARDLLERMGYEDAQSLTAADVVELANLIASHDEMVKIIGAVVDAVSPAMRIIQ
jgi:hypothetical protein